MKFYFFENAPAPYSSSFKMTYVAQNLNSVRIVAYILFSISSLLLLSSAFIKYEAFLSKTPEFLKVNFFLSFISGAALATEYLLRTKCRSYTIIQCFCLLYALLFILACIYLSFIPQQNPKNNMTMYLLGTLSVGVLWILSLPEAVLLMLCINTCFTLGVYFTSLPLEQEVLNCFGSVFILTCFFVLNRMIYSYRINHFMQLQDIQSQKQEIQKISRAKSDILGVVAHDLRSPFANIEMITKLIQRKKLSASQEEQYLDLILTSCQKSKAIINDLLEMARIEQDDSYPLYKSDINVYLKEVYAEWQQHLNGTKQLVFHQSEKPLYVNLNKEKFARVLDNLLSNANKFTPENGVIELKVAPSGNEVIISVADSGIGISQKLIPFLFAPFSKAGRKGLKGEASVGLGLSITRKLVEQHKGTIEVSSEEHRGTTFSIKLPACA